MPARVACFPGYAQLMIDLPPPQTGPNAWFVVDVLCGKWLLGAQSD